MTGDAHPVAAPDRAGLVFADTALTEDAFLGGQLTLLQPKTGYRAGVDPVLLAAAVPARPGQSVLDLGCGAGAAGLCLATRVAGLTLSGVEVQPAYGDLARRNATRNGIAMEVTCADLSALPSDLRQKRFDHVIANPPYFDATRRSQSPDAGRETALAEETPLALWIDVMARRLAPKGYAHVIHRTERFPDLLAACAGRLGSIEVLPLAGRANRASHLMILRARKGGRAAFRLHAPLILHEGEAHLGDHESYRPEIKSILRDGKALAWP